MNLIPQYGFNKGVLLTSYWAIEGICEGFETVESGFGKNVISGKVIGNPMPLFVPVSPGRWPYIVDHGTIEQPCGRVAHHQGGVFCRPGGGIQIPFELICVTVVDSMVATAANEACRIVAKILFDSVQAFQPP